MKLHQLLAAGTAFAMLTASASSAWCADKEVETLLANMRDAYRHIKTAAFTTEQNARTRTFITTFVFEAPDHMRTTIRDKANHKPGGFGTILSDGEDILFRRAYSRVFNRSPYSLDAFERGLPVNLESLNFFDWDRQLSTTDGKNMSRSTFEILKNQPWNGKKWTVLVETARSQGVICHYYIDPKTFLMWRTISDNIGVKPAAGHLPISDQWITKLQIPVKVSATDFNPYPRPSEGEGR